MVFDKRTKLAFIFLFSLLVLILTNCWSFFSFIFREKEVARKYYDKLFKEYCIADLSRYKENKVCAVFYEKMFIAVDYIDIILLSYVMSIYTLHKLSPSLGSDGVLKMKLSREKVKLLCFLFSDNHTVCNCCAFQVSY